MEWLNNKKAIALVKKRITSITHRHIQMVRYISLTHPTRVGDRLIALDAKAGE
ncbi:hypothetical protein [Nostoc sp. MS1]|uniref:hypothetical protein n=1 Tax=Nostoc sp. MS1 TaxID=2764711 RepID=UPI001CC671B7|nr:hypothetical protein [Nostoc sp. MS1]